MPRRKSSREHMTLLHENPRPPTVLRAVIERLDTPHRSVHAPDGRGLAFQRCGRLRKLRFERAAYGAQMPRIDTAPRQKRASAMSNGWHEAERGELSAKGFGARSVAILKPHMLVSG
jgi:hypothetical protein